MRALLSLVVAAALAASPARAAESTEAMQASGQAVVGKAAPWFSGWTLDDQVLNQKRLLQQKAGGYALVLFATWCKPCEEGLRALKARQAQLAERRVQVVLVAVGETSERVGPWIRERGMSELPVLVDQFSQIGRVLGAITSQGGKEETSLPRTVVLDSAGTVRAVFGREGPDYVDRVLAAAAPPPP